PERLAASPEVRERFLREARMAAKLSHPNIVPIYRADELAGVAFFVMGYVNGPSLADRLAQRGALSALEAAPLLRDVARALGYAHARGVVHRDVKPENILIEPDPERALVTDFGIARLAETSPLTGTGQVLGTVHYMSPEQANGEQLDGRSDLYSLGVVAFRALTGRLPFDNESAIAVLVAHASKAPPRVRDVNPAVPESMAGVIDRCLAKDPSARYQTGAELASAIDHAAGEIAGDPAALMRAVPVISEREAQALWARAAQFQAETGVQPAARAPAVQLPPPSAHDRRSLTAGYRMSAVVEAAEEAGIPQRYVVRAAEEQGLAPAPVDARGIGTLAVVPADLSPAPNKWAGGAMSIIHEVEVQGEVRDTDVESLVNLIRHRLGELGIVSSMGRTLHWSSNDRKRQLQISIISRRGRTTIRADERMRPIAGGIFGGVVGGAGGGTSGLTMGLGSKLLHSVVAGFALWGVGIGACYLLARHLFRRARDKRDQELRALVTELAKQITP
ncbi:MAG TPA: serine/threonine-protein kinase, partial [Gemmatimonadaceae bacterium]|nr:serine/threonine-protein kinase [Gemmatimonadaceae bacterium]